MSSKFTLILLFNLLILNESHAKDSALEACDAAIYQRQYSEAVKIAEQHASQPELWLCKGRAQAALEQYSEAEQSFKKAIALNLQGLDLISAHMLLGNVQQEVKKMAAALESYQHALKLSEQQKMRRYEHIAHNLIGEAFYNSNQYPDALKEFQTSEKLASNDDERADSFIHEAMTYQQLQQMDKAIEYQLKATMMLHKSGTPEQYAEASLTLGKLFFDNKDYTGAEKTYQRLMQYAQENGGSFYEAKTAIYLAEVKRTQGDAASAQRLRQQAETIATQLKDAELDELLKKNK